MTGPSINTTDNMLDMPIDNIVGVSSDQYVKNLNTPVESYTNPPMFANYAATIFDTKITTNVPMAVTISADNTIATVTPALGTYVEGIEQYI